jgi:hypothetical protein
MISQRDPTPEELAIRSQRQPSSASRHSTGRFFGYSNVVFGILWFIVAMVYWSRARKYES